MNTAPHALSGGARLQRGFRRAGLVVAAPIAVLGTIGCFVWGINEAIMQGQRQEQALCIMEKLRAGRPLTYTSYSVPPQEVRLRDSGCLGPLYSEPVSMIEAYSKARPDYATAFAGPALGGGAASVVLAALIYAVFAAFGWVLAGFSRD